MSIHSIYKDSPNVFKLIFDKNHRPEFYDKIISNENKKEESLSTPFDFQFSVKEKNEAATKISRLDYIQISSNGIKEREYISNFLVSKFTKTCTLFFGIMFFMNLFFIILVRRQLKYKFPFKANEDFVRKMKKIVRMKKILFFTLIIYEIGFGLLVIKNYQQYQLISKQILPQLEGDIVISYKLDLDKYTNLFSFDKII